MSRVDCVGSSLGSSVEDEHDETDSAIAINSGVVFVFVLGNISVIFHAKIVHNGDIPGDDLKIFAYGDKVR